MTEEFDHRHMVQLSTFTIHGLPTSLEDFIGEEGFLYKMIIPGNAKKRFRESLDLIGISESSLFPDLEHLAKEIETAKFEIAP